MSASAPYGLRAGSAELMNIRFLRASLPTRVRGWIDLPRRDILRSMEEIVGIEIGFDIA